MVGRISDGVFLSDVPLFPSRIFVISSQNLNTQIVESRYINITIKIRFQIRMTICENKNRSFLNVGKYSALLLFKLHCLTAT